MEAKKGVDLSTVLKLLRHSSMSITEKYSHLSPDHRAKAVAVLNFETNLKLLPTVTLGGLGNALSLNQEEHGA